MQKTNINIPRHSLSTDYIILNGVLTKLVRAKILTGYECRRKVLRIPQLTATPSIHISFSNKVSSSIISINNCNLSNLGDHDKIMSYFY